jgi:hypothetical protein
MENASRPLTGEGVPTYVHHTGTIPGGRYRYVNSK